MKKDRQPDLTVEIFLAPHGYQINIKWGEDLYSTHCRYFADDHPIHFLRKGALSTLLDVVESYEFRNSIEKNAQRIQQNNTSLDGNIPIPDGNNGET